MTLAEARSALQARGYGQDTQAAQDLIFKNVVAEVWSMRRWDFRLGTDTTTATISDETPTLVATDVDSVDSVRIAVGTEYYDLEWLPYQEILASGHEDQENNIPRYWNYTNGVLRLYPRPDKAYTVTVQYVKTLPALADGTSLPGPPDFHDLYVYGAIRDIAARERDAAMGQWADSMFQRRIGQLATQHGFKQRHSGRRLKKSGFFDD